MTYSSEVLADAPIIWLRLNETSGTVAADSSGNSHPGTYVGGYTQGATGVTGTTATLFDGSSGKITTAYTPGASSAWTIECWVLDPAMATSNRVFATGWTDNVSETSFQLRNVSTSTYRFDVRGGPSASTYLNVDYVLPSQTLFHHHVFTWDGNTVLVYVDGTLITSGSFAPSGGMLTHAHPLGLAYNSNYNGDFLSGTLQDFALYPTALSQARIQAHFAATGYTATVGRSRMTDLWIESVIANLPTARTGDLWIESVIANLPTARTSELWTEAVRLIEGHVNQVWLDVIVKPAAYASSVAMRTRTNTASGVALLDSVPRVAPVHLMNGITSRTRTAPSPVFTLYSSTATAINTSTPARIRTRTSTSTLIRTLLGDTIASAVNLNGGSPVGINWNNFHANDYVDYPLGRDYLNSVYVKFQATSVTQDYIIVNDTSYSYHYLYTSTVGGNATHESQLINEQQFGYYGFATTVTFTGLSIGTWYYVQITPYSSSYYTGATTVKIPVPPVTVEMSSSHARTRTSSSSVLSGVYTIYVNVGSPTVHTITARTRVGIGTLDPSILMLAPLVLDEGAQRSRMGSGTVTLDTPIVDPPIDITPLGIRPSAPSVVVDNDGTGSLPGGVYSFKVAYYVGLPSDGRVSAPSDESIVTLGDYTPPPPPIPDPPPSSTGLVFASSPEDAINDITSYAPSTQDIDLATLGTSTWNSDAKLRTFAIITATAPRQVDLTFSATVSNVMLISYASYDPTQPYATSSFAQQWTARPSSGSTFSILLRANDVYTLVISGDPASTTPMSGTATLSVTTTPAVSPSNDTFAAAQVLSGASGLVNFDSSFARDSETSAQPLNGSHDALRPLWFTWTAPASGNYYFGVLPKGTVDDSVPYIDTTLGVYTGASLGALSLVAYDDDDATWDPYGYASYVTIAATSGTQYFIRITPYDAAYWGNEYAPGQLAANTNYYEVGPGQLMWGAA